MDHVPYLTQEPFIANTDRAWFDFLASRAFNGRVDEVNFWLPRAISPMKAMTAGEPLFFRLKTPDRAIAGYAFFAHFQVVDLRTAWSTFGWKNGDADQSHFLERIGKYRGVNLLDPRVIPAPIGCTILRDATFWPSSRWIPWGATEGWAGNIVQGKTERDRERAARLIAQIRADAMQTPADLTQEYSLAQIDERALVLREVVDREGQGAFRLRLLDAYKGQCAITGEHTQPVLDAAHIQTWVHRATTCRMGCSSPRSFMRCSIRVT